MLCLRSLLLLVVALLQSFTDTAACIGDPRATIGDPMQQWGCRGGLMTTVAFVFQGRSRDWTRLAEDTKGGRSRAATPRGGEGRGVLDEPGAGEAIIGARVGIFWEDDETFYKASSSVCVMS